VKAPRSRAVGPRFTLARLLARRPQSARLVARRERAQGMVEFALALPIFLMIMAVAMQMAFLLTAQISIIWVTSQVVRHIATGSPENWQLADSCHTTYKNNTIAAFPLLRSGGVTTYTIAPAYTPGATNCAAVTGNTPATTRVRGGPIKVTMQYNPASLMFIPSTFFGVPVLQTLPAYTASSVME
jgi:hypothetical protein